jgi:sodium/proline symporter
MIENQIAVGITFLVYLVVMLGIGLWSYMRTSDMSDYILGGRNLGPFPSALSAGASDMSGWLLLGLPGYAFAAGFEAVWIAAGLLVGTWLNWLIVARRLRVYTKIANDSLTIPEFLENRFEDHSHMLRVISAFFILMFFLFYTSSGLVAGGKLFETVFGLDYQFAVLAGAAAVVSYTLFGGFLAVSWTDVVQGLLMAAALVIVPVVAITSDGGWSATTSAMQEQNPALLNAWSNANNEPLGLIAILSLLGWGLGYFGQPHILARFKAVRSERDIPVARRIAVSWTAISLTGSVACGIAAIAFFGGEVVDDPEKVFILLINAMFHPVMAGILLAAILAAVMSTADSQLLVSSSALAEDFYKALYRKDASQDQLVKVGRVAVIVIAIVATIIAFDPESKVLGMVSYAWAGFGAAFGPVLVMALFWKRMNRQGALAGVLVGGITVVVWKQISGGIFDLYEIIPGVILAYIGIVVVSLATAQPSKTIQDQFENAVGNP